MGRTLAITFLLTFLTGCLASPIGGQTFSACADSDILLLPHHALVSTVIEEMYQSIQTSPEKIIVIGPNHFSTSFENIQRTEDELSFTIHQDFAQTYFPAATIEGWMVKTSATQDELTEFAETLAAQDALFIFSVDFSHYLPGEIALVHDLRSKDIIEARSIDEAASIEADSPQSIEVMLRLFEKEDQTLQILKNTNPSLDTATDSFDNTTHLFGCSAPGEAPSRQLQTKMEFAHPEQWYQGKTAEDRYLYGYDETKFEQGGQDKATIEYADGRTEEYFFDYFD